MVPLSILYYFLNNKRKIIPVALSICLGVMFFYFLFLVGMQSDESGKATYIRPFECFSWIYSENSVPQNIIDGINANKNIARVIPMHQFPHTSITRALGNGSAGIMYVRKSDISYLMGIMGLKLVKGRMPSSGNEILLHWSVAANKKLVVGDTFKDDNEIQGKYKVTGIIKGKSILGFIPAEIKGAAAESRQWKNTILIPRQGRLEEMNRFIEKIVKDKGLYIETLERNKKDMEESNRNLHLVMYLLVSIVITVLCITLGNTSIMHFYQRRSEFGVLTAVGYTRRQIVWKIWLEAVFAGGVSYIIGIVLSMLCAVIINILFWHPIGENVPLFAPKGLLVTAAIPVFVTVFSVLPISKLLGKEDLINVIEGN